MPRKASSVSEIAQIARVHGLLNAIGVAPSPLLEVTTAGGKVYAGQLIRAVAGNTQAAKGGWTSYGAIMLATAAGNVEIDYLDVATVEAAIRSAPDPQFRKTRKASRRP